MILKIVSQFNLTRVKHSPARNVSGRALRVLSRVAQVLVGPEVRAQYLGLVRTQRVVGHQAASNLVGQDRQ